MSKNCGA